MKKQYTKPSLGIERFSLTQCIATNCGGYAEAATLGIPMHEKKDVCALNVGGIAVFSNDVSACFLKVGDNDSYAGYCYDNPNGGITIYNSF